MLNFFYNVKRHFKFSREEIRNIVYLILLFTFVLGYNDGYDEFILSRWIFNLFNSFVIATSAVLAKECGQKLMAIHQGYTCKTSIRWYMFAIIAGLTFLTRGFFPWLLPVTGLMVTHNARMKHGSFRYGHNYFDNTLIAFGGIMFNIYLAFFFKIFSFIPNALILDAMQVNILYGLLSFIPIDMLLVFFYSNRYLEKIDLRKRLDPFPGTYIFFGSRYFFIFSLSFMLLLSVLMFVSGIIVTTIFAFLCGIAISLAKSFRTEFTA